MNTNDGALEFDVKLGMDDLSRQIDMLKRQISGVSSHIANEGDKMDATFKKIGAAAAAYFSFEMMKGFTSQLVRVRGEFQQLDVAFTTMLGSKAKADTLMAQIIDTAAKTPFTLTEVASGAKQLLAYQIAAEDVNETVIRLGNIAAGVSVPLDRLILAYGQVKAKGRLMGDDMRQFTEAGIPIIHELAKVMGVADSEISKMVETGKIGFEQVQQVIQNLTNDGGMFFNLMEKQSKTLTGQLSNLQDAWDRMLNKIGESNEGLLSGTIKGATNVVEHYQEILDVLVPIIAAYGSYKAVVIAAAAAQRAAALWDNVRLIGMFRKELGLATAAQQAFNKASLANPYALAVAAIVGLGIAIYKMASNLTAAEKAQESYNKRMDEANDKITEEKSKVGSLIAVINDETNSREYRNQKLRELIALSPEHLNNLTLENIKMADGKAALDAYITSLEKKIRMQSLEAELTESIKRMQEAQDGKKNLSFWDKMIAAGASAGNGYGGAAPVSYNDMTANMSYENNQEVIAAEKALQEKIKEQIASLTMQQPGQQMADVVINAEYWEKQVKEAKDALDKLDTKGTNYEAERARLLGKITEGEAELKKIRGDKGKQKDPTKQLEDELEKQKLLYETYYAYIEMFGEEAANKQFENLLKQGDSYTAYLEKVYEEQKAKASGPNATTADLERLNEIYNRLREARGEKSPFEQFQEELSNINNTAKTTSEYLERLASLRNDINSGNTNLNPEERTRALQMIDLDSAEERRKMLDDIYNTYKTNFQRMEDLQRQYNEDIKALEKALTEAKTQEEKDRIQAVINARKQAYSEDTATLIEQSEEYRKYFGDISDVTLSTLNNTLNALRLMVQEAYDSGEITYEKYMELIGKINKQQGNNTQGRGLEMLFGGSKGGGFANMMFGEGDMNSKISQFSSMFKGAQGSTQAMSANMSSAASKAASAIAIIDAIVKAIYQTIKAVTDVADAIADLKDSYGKSDSAEKTKNWTSVLNTVNEGAMGAWNKLKSGDVMGALSESISMPLKVWTQINKIHDSKIDKSIAKHKDAVKDLERAYNDLERAVDSALGSAVYNNQVTAIDNLKKQQQEYRQMIFDESQKKKVDQDKIDEYQDQIKALSNAIEDTINSMRENILGGAVKDIADGLGDAIITAFANGENAAEAWGDKVNDIVGDVIKKMLIQKLVEEPVGRVLNRYLNKWVDKEGNFVGFDTVMNDSIKMGNELNSLSGSILAVLNQLPDSLKQTLSLGTSSSLAGSISASITEDTATLLAGYINAIRINQLNSINIMNQMLSQIFVIADNTRYNKFLENIDRSLTKLSGDSLRAMG